MKWPQWQKYWEEKVDIRPSWQPEQRFEVADWVYQFHLNKVLRVCVCVVIVSKIWCYGQIRQKIVNLWCATGLKRCPHLRSSCGKHTLLLFSFFLLFPVSSLSFPHFASLSCFLFPCPLLFSKTIKVKIIDDEEYEKNKTFYIEIGEPRLVENNDTKGQQWGSWPLDILNLKPPN